MGTDDSAAHERLACEPHTSEGGQSSWLEHRDEMMKRGRRSTYCERLVNEFLSRGGNITGMDTTEESNRRTIVDNPHLLGASLALSGAVGPVDIEVSDETQRITPEVDC